LALGKRSVSAKRKLSRPRPASEEPAPCESSRQSCGDDQHQRDRSPIDPAQVFRRREASTRTASVRIARAQTGTVSSWLAGSKFRHPQSSRLAKRYCAAAFSSVIPRTAQRLQPVEHAARQRDQMAAPNVAGRGRRYCLQFEIWGIDNRSSRVCIPWYA
jgi:hypothetical protein